MGSEDEGARRKTWAKERISLFTMKGLVLCGRLWVFFLFFRVANWPDSKNAMHKAKKCQKVPL